MQKKIFCHAEKITTVVFLRAIVVNWHGVNNTTNKKVHGVVSYLCAALRVRCRRAAAVRGACALLLWSFSSQPVIVARGGSGRLELLPGSDTCFKRVFPTEDADLNWALIGNPSSR